MGNKPASVRPTDGEPEVKRLSILDRWPECTFYEAWDVEPAEIVVTLTGRPVPSGALFANKRTILLGLPGAYTPNCHRIHIPQYVQAAAQFRALGVDQIIGLSSNDVFCNRAWAESLNATQSVRLLSDPEARTTKSLGLALDARGTVGRFVPRRFCALLEDGVVKLLYVEDGDGLGVSCSAACPMLSEVTSKKYEKILGADHVWRSPTETLQVAATSPSIKVHVRQASNSRAASTAGTTAELAYAKPLTETEAGPLESATGTTILTMSHRDDAC